MTSRASEVADGVTAPYLASAEIEAPPETVDLAEGTATIRAGSE